jgi:hypothetical protein
MRYEVPEAMDIDIVVLWNVISFNSVDRYQNFEEYASSIYKAEDRDSMSFHNVDPYLQN